MNRITEDFVLGVNYAICDDCGQHSSVINLNNLKSALSVQDSYYTSDEEIACALFRSLIIGHPFSDGNKRTAVVCLYSIQTPDVSDSIVEDVALMCASGKLKDVEAIRKILYRRDQ